MISEPQTRIDPRAIKAWSWSGAWWSCIYWLLTIAAFILTSFAQQWWVIPISFLVLSAFLTWLQVILFPRLKWKRWLYEIREEEIDLKRGIWFVERSVIPVVRIQHVDTVQGPILRRFGLANVTFSTAAGGHEIPALDVETANDVRMRISKLARLSNEEI